MNVAPWFQSLIGKLQTTEHLFVNPLDIEFQSLIGKLQTDSSCSEIHSRQLVSIPHR